MAGGIGQECGDFPGIVPAAMHASHAMPCMTHVHDIRLQNSHCIWHGEVGHSSHTSNVQTLSMKS